VLAGRVKGEPNPRGKIGVTLIITADDVRISYSENSL